jgi:hypothetical protein
LISWVGRACQPAGWPSATAVVRPVVVVATVCLRVLLLRHLLAQRLSGPCGSARLICPNPWSGTKLPPAHATAGGCNIGDQRARRHAHAARCEGPTVSDPRGAKPAHPMPGRHPSEGGATAERPRPAAQQAVRATRVR